VIEKSRTCFEMKCEICKEKPATQRKKLSFSSYFYDVCDGCWEDMNKRGKALQILEVEARREKINFSK
jgi:hypothetical protein